MGKFSGESEFVAVLNFLSLNNLRLALELLCFSFGSDTVNSKMV